MKKTVLILMLFVFAVIFAAAGGEPTAAPSDFSIGEWNGNVYTNDFLGISYKLPDGWIKYSDEEIAAVMNLSMEMLNDNQKALADLAKLTVVYYMLVKNPATGENISVFTEKVHLDVTSIYYLENLKAQLSTLTAINYTIGDFTKETVGGREYDVLTATTSVADKTLTQKYYCCKLGKYFLSIVASSMNGEKAAGNLVKAFE